MTGVVSPKISAAGLCFYPRSISAARIGTVTDPKSEYKGERIRDGEKKAGLARTLGVSRQPVYSGL